MLPQAAMLLTDMLYLSSVWAIGYLSEFLGSVDLVSLVITSIAQHGPIAVLLAGALWWMTKDKETTIHNLNQERKDFIMQVQEEREAHFSTLTGELQRLRARSDECERDRLEMHKQIAFLVKHST